MRSLSFGVIAILATASIASLYAADSASTETTTTMNAATTVSPSAGSSAGEYAAVNCNSNSTFSTNNCNQCFDGGSVKVGQRLTGLFDTWTNNTTNPLIAYRDEQKTPNIVKFGQTDWTSTPASEASIWKKDLPDIVWGTGSRQSYILAPSNKVRFIEAEMNAGYTLEKTDRKNGEIVGMLRYPVVSHVSNIQTASEGAADTHYECVVYKLDAPVVTTPNNPPITTTNPPTTTPTTTTTTPTKPTVVTPKPTPITPTNPNPGNMTQTETGPETLILIAAAFFIAFGLMMTLRKRS